MIAHPLLATAVWLAVALGVCFSRARGQRWTLVALIVTGVPVLGLLTHGYGGLFGLAAFLLGIGILKIVHHGHRTPSGGFSLTRPERDPVRPYAPLARPHPPH